MIVFCGMAPSKNCLIASAQHNDRSLQSETTNYRYGRNFATKSVVACNSSVAK